MCAYNAINGEPACANQYLLQDQLRGKWGFQGYVVSDCDAVRTSAANHRYRPTQAQGAAISVIRGMDNECVDIHVAVWRAGGEGVRRCGAAGISAGERFWIMR